MFVPIWLYNYTSILNSAMPHFSVLCYVLCIVQNMLLVIGDILLHSSCIYIHIYIHVRLCVHTYMYMSRQMLHCLFHDAAYYIILCNTECNPMYRLVLHFKTSWCVYWRDMWLCSVAVYRIILYCTAQYCLQNLCAVLDHVA